MHAIAQGFNNKIKDMQTARIRLKLYSPARKRGVVVSTRGLLTVTPKTKKVGAAEKTRLSFDCKFEQLSFVNQCVFCYCFKIYRRKIRKHFYLALPFAKAVLNKTKKGKLDIG